MLATGLYAQVYRYRHVSSPGIRRQTKWVVFGTSVALSVIFLLVLLLLIWPQLRDNVVLTVLLSSVYLVSITLIPVSIGIAILRSRLYDIDLLVNRTLVYSAVTAVMAGLLAVCSELSKRFFLTVTGGATDLAPILATLTIVAFFDPVRKASQKFVDRHFKYPARSFGEFGDRLRSHVELSDPEALVKTFVREAVSRFDARSGAGYRAEGAQLRLVHEEGAVDGEPALSMPLTCDGLQVGLLTLGARRQDVDYDQEAREALASMGTLVARSLRVTYRPEVTAGEETSRPAREGTESPSGATPRPT
jgi:hypothetical protein